MFGSKSKETMMSLGHREASVLKSIRDVQQNEGHDLGMVRLISSFDWKGHHCLVMEQLGSSLAHAFDT